MTASIPSGTVSRGATDSLSLSRAKYIASKIFGVLVLLFLAFLVVFPVYYSFAGSLMKQEDIASYPPAVWPVHGITWNNLATAAQIIPLMRQYVNSLGATLVITVAQVLTSTLVAYALVILKVKGRRVWFVLFLSTMMIPGESVIIPNYLTISSLGLRNTFLALVLPFLASGFGVFMMHSFMRQFLAGHLHLPDSLERLLLALAGHGDTADADHPDRHHAAAVARCLQPGTGDGRRRSGRHPHAVHHRVRAASDRARSDCWFDQMICDS